MMADTDSLVEVLGLSEKITDDFLTLYFENKRRSGGGAVQSVARNGSRALLTFCNVKDAEAVLSRAEHRVQGAVLHVRRPPPWDPRKVALCGLSADLSQDLLEMYVENVSRREAFSIERSADGGAALVSFPEPLSEEEFQHLEAQVENKALHLKRVTVQRVHSPADILVKNIAPDISPDLLEMYFESRRSRGGALHSLTMLRNNSAAIISFCDWKVAQNVLERSHCLQNCQLSVLPWYPELLGSPFADSPGEPMEETGALQVPAEEAGDIGEPQQGRSGQDGAGELPMDEVQPLQKRALRSRIVVAERTVTPPPDDVMLDAWEAAAPSLAMQEAEVVMEEAELRYFQEYHHELLAGMDAVTIFPLDERNRFGFKVVGEAVPCREAKVLLQHMLSSLSSRMVTLDYPGIGNFLLGPEGWRSLRNAEQQHQCVIDTSRVVQPAQLTNPQRPVDDVITPEPEEDPEEMLRALREAYPWLPYGSAEEKAKAEARKQRSKRKAALRSAQAPQNAPEEDLDTKQDSAGEGTSDTKKDSAEGTSDTKKDSAGEGTSDTKKGSTGAEMSDTKEDFAGEGSETLEVQDKELEEAMEMSRRAYEQQQLDEEAQMQLAIQRSMDTSVRPATDDEDEEMQRALEMSLMWSTSEDPEQSSRTDQPVHDGVSGPQREPPLASTNSAQLWVLSADETSLVVACAALRKAVLSHFNMVTLEGVRDAPHLAHVVPSLERKYNVKVTALEGKIQIQGFLNAPSQCRQELQQTLDSLQATDWAQASMMTLNSQRDVELVDVPRDSEEYNRVIQPFLQILQDINLGIDICQVQRVQNPLLYNQYQLKKLRMTMTDPSRPAERILYHGTSESSAQEICHHGFNRSFCGKNAVMYGQGVYFAVGSELPTRDAYSPPNKDGKKFVLVARVLTGEFTVGNSSMRTPPLMPRPSGGPEGLRRYDSLVNDTNKPTVFVIFNDTQAYPEYLLTCENRLDFSPARPCASGERR